MILRLSFFWLTYFAALGIFFPFFGLYLQQDLGLSPSRIGWVLAAVPWVGLVAQPAWGRFADRSGSRRLTLAVALAATAVLYSVLGLLPAFWPVFLGTVTLACFSTVVVPMGTAVSMACLDPGGHRPGGSGGRFGIIRMWGTVGFLISVVALPPALEHFRESGLGPWHGLGLIFPLAAFWTFLAVPSILALPPSDGLYVRAERGDTRRILRHLPVPRLLIFAFSANLVMQAPIQLLPLLVTDRGGDASWISEMWIYMLLVEIPLVAFSGPFLRRLGARGLLALGMLSEGARWLATALISDFAIFRWIQLLHGLGVAGVFVGAAFYIEESVPARSRSTAQSLAGWAAGLGTILSLALGGEVFEHLGADAPYLVSGVAGLLLAACAFRILPRPTRPSP